MTLLSPPPQNAPAAPTTRARRVRSPRPAALPRPAPRQSWDPLTVDAEGAAPEDYDLPPVRRVHPPPLEDLSEVASVLTKAVAEVLLGTRPAQQVQTWLVEDVWHVVRRRASLGRRSPQGASLPSTVQVMRVHPCQVDERTCEVSVVFHDGRRVRAAALRLTLHRQRWRAAAIRIG